MLTSTAAHGAPLAPADVPEPLRPWIGWALHGHERARCPLEPKPSCRLCTDHCYAPTHREQIREVMKFSGRHLILRGRLHLLFHFLQRTPEALANLYGFSLSEGHLALRELMATSIAV